VIGQSLHDGATDPLLSLSTQESGTQPDTGVLTWSHWALLPAPAMREGAGTVTPVSSEHTSVTNAPSGTASTTPASSESPE